MFDSLEETDCIRIGTAQSVARHISDSFKIP